MKTAATSVPIASDPLPIIWPPTQSTDGHRDDAEELDPREEERVQPLGMRVGAPVRVVACIEFAEERALAVVGLDHGHPRDRLGDLRGHRRDRLAHLQECGV